MSSILTVTPWALDFNGSTASRIRPTGVPGLAIMGCGPVDAGVGPKKIQKAFPGGQ